MYHSECIHFYNGLRLEYSLHLHFQCHADRKCNCNNFYFTENKNYYDQPSPVNAIISFNLKTSGHVNYDGDVISSQATKRIIITIENGIIKINSNGVSSSQSNTSKSNNTKAEISELSIETN